MELIPIQDDVLINPEKIIAVDINRGKGSFKMKVHVEGRTFEVTRSPDEFIKALNKSGVDLSKQFFSV